MTSPRLTAERREALELLASDPHGATEELLVLAYGFDGDMVAGLVRRGLATPKRESMKAGGKTIKVVCVRVTAAGRSAVEGCRGRDKEVWLDHRYFLSAPIQNKNYEPKGQLED